MSILMPNAKCTYKKYSVCSALDRHFSFIFFILKDITYLERKYENVKRTHLYKTLAKGFIKLKLFKKEMQLILM
jgi:hypothetical protein